MMATALPPSQSFIIEALDREYCCPVLQARFAVPALAALRAVLGAQAQDDPDLRRVYFLDPAEMAAVVTAFDVCFDPPVAHMDVCLSRPHSIDRAPYLVHTGYELPLLLDGRKKLARMGDAYPPMRFDGEDRFDHWVAQGVLHREEVIEPFDNPTKRWHGHRTVYYTPKGEEWRIRAMQLVMKMATKSGGWNEHFERLEGMLFGYEDWQNDWWIEHGILGGGFGGVRLCCAVNAAGLAWIEAAGFRALPPIDKPDLIITNYDAAAEAEMRAFMLEEADTAALVCFNVFGGVVSTLSGVQTGPPWRVPSGRIADLNRTLRRSVTIVARRHGTP
jgi:hypothetical protein